jgi:hypothetical protein
MKLVKPNLHRVAGMMNEYVRDKLPWSRDDTVIHLTTEPLAESPETPAWYYRTKADIYLNVKRILGDDFDETSLMKPKVYQMLWGFITHEALHSVYSNWDIKAPPAVQETLTLFEELRIEKRGVDRGSVAYLRHSFAWLLNDVLARKHLSTSPWAIAHLWALAYGRHLAGIAATEEVTAIDALARTELGDHTVDLLREILSEAMVLHIPGHYGRAPRLEQLRLLAVEWLELLGVDSEAQPPMLFLFVEDAEGTGDGEGEAEDEDGKDGHTGLGKLDGVEETAERTPDETPYVEVDPETSELLREALRETAESVDQPMPEAPPTPIALADPAEWAKIFKPRALGAEWATKVPTPDQRAKARRLAQTLEALSLPTIAREKVRSVAPPGRLRGRAALRQAADRSRSAMTVAEPWERTKRRRTHTKPVVVGVMTDVSGSMSWAQEFVAEFAWVVATAGIHIGARTAAVTFGNTAEAVIQPGEIPQLVKVRSANGSEEAFDCAAAAIESVLHLAAPTAYSKVLFIVSDGQLVRTGEPQRAQRWIEQWTSAGTIVVWIAAQYHWNFYKNGERRPGVLHDVQVPTGRLGEPSMTEKLYHDLSREVMAAASKVV